MLAHAQKLKPFLLLNPDYRSKRPIIIPNKINHTFKASFQQSALVLSIILFTPL